VLQPELGAPRQQELPPVIARKAAWPYFSLTTSLMSEVLMVSPICRAEQLVRLDLPGCEYQHSAYRNCRSSWSASVLALYRRNVLSC
jgi:hypothetical protein